MSDPNDIYRKAALDHYLTAHELGEITRVSPPWTRTLALLAIAMVGTAALLASMRVEVADRTPAIFVSGSRALSFVSQPIAKGDFVILELEGGKMSGRIDHVDARPALPHEIRAALGQNVRSTSPVHRVEIAVVESSSTDQAPMPLRSGRRADVRHTVRRERLIVILEASMRRWWNG